MKKSEIEQSIKILKDLKKSTEKLDFNTSVLVNQHVMGILPILEKEYARLDEDKIELNCPELKIIGVDTTLETNKKEKLADEINRVMRELVSEEYKIVDYGIVSPVLNNVMYAYIKYTR